MTYRVDQSRKKSRLTILIIDELSRKRTMSVIICNWLLSNYSIDLSATTNLSRDSITFEEEKRLGGSHIFDVLLPSVGLNIHSLTKLLFVLT